MSRVVVAEREIYPSAPIRYVACEVRFPYSPPLTTDAAIQRLHSALGSGFPLVEPGTEATIVLGPQGGIPAAEVRTVRFLARERQRAIYVTPTQFLVETTNYGRYEDFRRDISEAATALLGLGDAIAGIGRIGLRYIDEVRVPTAIGRPRDWHGFIDERLLSPLELNANSTPPDDYLGLVRYDLGERRTVAMRFGSRHGRAVGDSPLLLKGPVADGPFFLIDIDSFWTAPEPLPAFDLEAILDTCDRLHSPIRDLFESAITDRLRDEVLRRGVG